MQKEFGLALRSDWGMSPTITFIEFAFHSHSEHDTEDCPFRFGFVFSFLGFHVDIGIFRMTAWE